MVSIILCDSTRHPSNVSQVAHARMGDRVEKTLTRKGGALTVTGVINCWSTVVYTMLYPRNLHDFFKKRNFNEKFN